MRIVYLINRLYVNNEKRMVKILSPEIHIFLFKIMNSDFMSQLYFLVSHSEVGTKLPVMLCIFFLIGYVYTDKFKSV